ncbi:MAG: TetR/AcrR family transcriptional regulator [Actinomycetota bacterium]
MTRIGGDERKKQLVEVALRAFGKRGYEATTLDEVATASGVRKQSLLYHFETKEELFHACVQELGARTARALDDALTGPEEGFDRVERVIAALFKLAREWPDFPGFIREAGRHSPDVVQQVASALDPLRKRALLFLERGMEAGVFRRQDPVLLLFSIYTAVVGSLTEAGVLRAVAGREGGREALERRQQELVEFVRAALEP